MAGALLTPIGSLLNWADCQWVNNAFYAIPTIFKTQILHVTFDTENNFTSDFVVTGQKEMKKILIWQKETSVSAKP